ncbi:MAG: cytochrome b/b6 domain-containing protein [Anaerolineae bacterium]|nr:cytochrome b/b6 domain-containing protein [Anaerolineae bacterium]
MTTQKERYLRFTLAQRLEHWIMMVSFTILCLTGLPQRYPLTTWADWIIRNLGGIEAVRIIHRISAVVFMLVLLYHIIMVFYRVYVLRVRLTMLPGLKDALDLLDSVRYQLGLIRQQPKLPRYTFAEKMEYWAVIWGGVIMVITGFMLWNPIATTRFLPGEFVPAAKAAHSAEALLAFLAIIIWHFYWVHLKVFNRSIFSGYLTREQMQHEHAAELEEIKSGRIPPPPPPEAKLRRERIFVPVASITAAVGLVSLYGFVTFEQTAITTVPPAETVVAFLPATPTPTLTPSPTPPPTPTPLGGVAEPVSVPLITHPLGGREDCQECHALAGPLPYPENHDGWPVSSCTVCHSTEQENPPPPPVEHKLQGREDCLKCHELDTLPESHQAADFTNDNCLICHAPADQTMAEADPTTEPETEPTAETPMGAVSFSADILPLLEENCATCHGSIAMGDLDVTSYEALVKGGATGPSIVPGSPDQSPLVTVIQGNHLGTLPEPDLQKLIAWVAAGAENN